MPLGNTIILSEDVSISINRSPKALFKAGTKLYVHSEFTYLFDKDTIVVYARETQPDLSTVWNSKYAQTVVLSSGAESANICSVTAISDTATGTIEMFAFVHNDDNGDADYLIRMYVESTLVATSPVTTVAKDTSHNLYYEHEIATAITAGQGVSFTVEVDRNNNSVVGGDTPSQIQVTRIT